MIDHSVGQILAALNSFGLEKNTIIIFTSDHGDFMADHGLILKGLAHFQGVLKGPFIWKVPGVTKSGSITNSLASSIDIPTTILNLLNIKTKEQPPVMQGHDLSPILMNPEKKVRLRRRPELSRRATPPHEIDSTKPPRGVNTQLPFPLISHKLTRAANQVRMSFTTWP